MEPLRAKALLADDWYYVVGPMAGENTTTTLF